MAERTPLYERHLELGAKMVDFGGWEMPLHYGSQLEEHHAVRQDAGVFDVSHMTVVEAAGAGAKDFLRHLLANDVARLERPGQAMYTAMLNEAGGVIDDLIVYDNSQAGGGAAEFLLVVNAATRTKDLEWLQRQVTAFDARVTERPELGILAVQGPNAMPKAQTAIAAWGRDASPKAQAGGRDAMAEGQAVAQADERRGAAALKPFQGAWAHGWFVARTGYTGERGYEVLLPTTDLPGFFDALLKSGVRPIGLGARDTLRLEAGLNLYGSDMDESVSPIEAGMASTVALDGRDFIGAQAVRQLQAQEHRTQIGIVMESRGVLRAGYTLFKDGKQIGGITSGAFSPTLQHSIALARVSGQPAPGDTLEVAIRDKRLPVTVVRPPFVRNGKKVF